MALLSEQVRDTLRKRFQTSLEGEVRLRLYTKETSGRLILPGGIGCPTCPQAREMAEEIEACAPEKVQLEVITEPSTDTEGEAIEVPTLTISSREGTERIRFQGLASGYEFAALVDAIERVSSEDSGLAPDTVKSLESLTEPVEVMVFATPS